MEREMAKIKILLVDDEGDIHDIVGDTLEAEGYEVHSAHNGIEAIATLQKDSSFDLIVLDLEMPESSGFDFRERQKREPSFAHIPVLIYSGYAADFDAVERLNANAYLKKPFSVVQLLNVVKQLVTK